MHDGNVGVFVLKENGEQSFGKENDKAVSSSMKVCMMKSVQIVVEPNYRPMFDSNLSKPHVSRLNNG